MGKVLIAAVFFHLGDGWLLDSQTDDQLLL